MINRGSVTLWGFVGTVVLTSVLAGSQALGLTPNEHPLHVGHHGHT